MEQVLIAKIKNYPTSFSKATTFENWTKKIYRYQFRYNPVFWKWRKSYKTYLPIIAFKKSIPICFKPRYSDYYFESSGTTSNKTQRSRHYLKSLHLYRASVIEGWRWYTHQLPFLQSTKNRFHWYALLPSFKEAPHSSLSCMLDILIREFASTNGFWVFHKKQWLWNKLALELKQLSKTHFPAVLFGTALGWVDFLSWCKKHHFRFQLPKNTLILETGGYKGQNRIFDRRILHERLQQLLGISINQIQSEYSMCEISSQAYSFRIEGHLKNRFVFQFPPWCQPRVVYPKTCKLTPRGKQGVLEICDFSNFHSCSFIRTEDSAILWNQQQFELVNRIPSAELKGCSLNFERTSQISSLDL